MKRWTLRGFLVLYVPECSYCDHTRHCFGLIYIVTLRQPNRPPTGSAIYVLKLLVPNLALLISIGSKPGDRHSSHRVSSSSSALQQPSEMSSTHLTILEHAASHYSSQDAFRIAQLDPTTGNVAQWKPITYGQFAHDVEVVAKYWSRIFRTQHIPPRSVIGMWYVQRSPFYYLVDVLTLLSPRIAGYSYTDLVQIYGLSRAGFIPQLFSLRLPNPEVIYELLKKAGASALIYESGFENVLHSCPIPTHRASDVSEMSSNSSSDEPLAPLPTLSPEDTAFYFHTSGSTSGSPKLVPVSYQGVGAAFNKLAIAFRPRDLNRQDVCTWM